MADKNIGALPQTDQLYDDSLFVVEHSGTAKHVTGQQFKEYAKEGVEVYVETAQNAAQEALDAVATIGTAVEDAQASKEAARLYAETAEREAEESKASAVIAEKESGYAEEHAFRAGVEADRAQSEADRAQAEAESVTIPAAVGVYNIILSDRATSERYALIVERGTLTLLGVSSLLEATEMRLVDSVTGADYELAVENGVLLMEEG